MSQPVLVVEPDATLRHVLVRLLRHEGCNVTTAADLAECRAALDGWAGIILAGDRIATDRSLGAALRSIRSASPAPVVLLVGSIDEQSAEEVRSVPDVLVAQKPLDRARLAELIGLAVKVRKAGAGSHVPIA